MKTLRTAINEYNNSVQKTKSQYSGLLGLTKDGKKLVEHPTRAGFVYVRLRDNLSEVAVAFNDKVSAIYDFPVIIQREGNRWAVIGKDMKRYDNWGSAAGVPYLPKHGYQHSLNREAVVGADPVWVFPDQFMPLLVYPSGTDSANNFVVSPYLLKRSADYAYVGNTGTPNITMYAPITGSVVGLIYLDKVTGNFGVMVNSGTVVDANYNTIAQIAPYIPYPATGTHEPLYAFQIASGTTTVGWNNLYNVRQFIGGAGGSAGGVSDHEALTGLLGGSANNHYHLTPTQIIGLVSGTSTGLHTHPTGTILHESLSDLLGGSANNHYHLTPSQVIGLVSGTFTNLHSHSGTIHSDNVLIPTLGNTSIDTLTEDITTRGSSGVVDGTLTYVSVGSTAVKISVAAGDGYIRTSNDQQAPLATCRWAASPDIYTFSAPAAGQENVIFIGVEYSGGTVSAVTKTAFTDWNWYTNFPLARASYDGRTMRILNAYAHTEDTANLTRKWMRLTHPFVREESPEGSGGLELSTSGRTLSMTAGKVWHGFNNYSLSAQSTGTFDTHYRRAGGGFNSTGTYTSFPNTQYDDGSGTLQDLTTNRYGVLWVYVDVSDGTLDVVYGAVNAVSVATAQADTVPTTPAHLQYHGRLIGRIIFQKSASSATLVESAWMNTFSASAVGDHNLLTNLQGGTSNQYYHLTAAETTSLTGLASSALHFHNSDRTDSNQTFTDNTTNDASTAAHGFLLKATAPASGIRNIVAIDNGETVYKNTALFDNVSPATSAATGSSGVSLIAARRDHIHGEKYAYPFSSYTVVGSGISTSGSIPYAATLPSFTTYMKQWNQGVFVGATNDGSNYWVFSLLDGGTSTVLASVSTQGLAAQAAYVLTASSFAISTLIQATHKYLFIRAGKVGTPSNVSAHGPFVEYALQ